MVVATEATEVGSHPNVDECGALLPAPDIVGGLDVGAEIALLAIRAGRDQEAIQQKTEQTENAIQDGAEQHEVQAMHQEASDIMSDAIASGVMQIGQGAMQWGGAASLASGPATNATSSLEDIAAAKEAQVGQGSFAAMGTLSQAGATLFAALGQSQRELDEAQVTSYKAMADRAGQLSSEASQGQADARSILSNAVSFYQEYVQTKAQVDLTLAGPKA
jgi:hypothetical protein